MGESCGSRRMRNKKGSMEMLHNYETYILYS